MKNRLSVSYWVAREQGHAVEVKAWFADEKWRWNIYLYIYELSPLFNDNDLIMDANMHCGVTYDAQKIIQPIGGCRYDWQGISKIKVVGCDYEHIYDDYNNHPSPFDYSDGSIPEPFYSDAKRTLEWVENKTAQKPKALEDK